MVVLEVPRGMVCVGGLIWSDIARQLLVGLDDDQRASLGAGDVRSVASDEAIHAARAATAGQVVAAAPAAPTAAPTVGARVHRQHVRSRACDLWLRARRSIVDARVWGRWR